MPVNETAVARLLNTTPDKVLPAIQQLHKEGVIEFRPMKDKPQLTFIKERVEANNLTIDLAAYQLRKERQQKRMQKAKAFIRLPQQ